MALAGAKLKVSVALVALALPDEPTVSRVVAPAPMVAAPPVAIPVVGTAVPSVPWTKLL